jgi:hypothetical protein
MNLRVRDVPHRKKRAHCSRCLKQCSNNIRVRKGHIEEVLLRGPETGLAALLAPERVQRIAQEMQTYYAERVRAMQTRAAETTPRELQELVARIERLRERLRTGDPDMPSCRRR